jgi:hypothetical protein
VSEERTQRFQMKKFTLKNLSEIEGKEQYQVNSFGKLRC